jgi:hypothetical protein
VTKLEEILQKLGFCHSLTSKSPEKWLGLRKYGDLSNGNWEILGVTPQI